MITVPENYPGPNVAGGLASDVPYYVFSHAAGSYLRDAPGPWAAGSLPLPAPTSEPTPPLPPGVWARYVFNNIEAGQTAGIYFLRQGNGPSYVDWGDGTVDELINDDYTQHTFNTTGPKTIYITGDSESANEIAVWYYGDSEQQVFLGADTVEVVSTTLVHLDIYGFPSSVIIDCQNLTNLYFFDSAYQISTSAAYYVPIVNSVSNFGEDAGSFLVLADGLEISADFSQMGVGICRFYSCTLNNLKIGSATRWFNVFGCTVNGIDFSQTNLRQVVLFDSDFTGSVVDVFTGSNFHTVIVNACTGISEIDVSNNNALSVLLVVNSNVSAIKTNNTAAANSVEFIGLGELAHVECSNSTYMDALLSACAYNSVNNGTFVGTGNGAPTGQAATDKNTLINRGWTVTTD